MRWARPLYIMIKPLPAMLADIRRLCAALGIHSKYSLDRLHCTFLVLGESSPGAIEAIRTALRTFDAEPFLVAFDHIHGNTLQPRKGLRASGAFQRQLARHLTGFGFPLPEYKF